MVEEQMSDCKHENRTIDCACSNCGYDFIVDPMTERIRNQEKERIIKLLEERLCLSFQAGKLEDCWHQFCWGLAENIAKLKGEPSENFGEKYLELVRKDSHYTALIKGENK